MKPIEAFEDTMSRAEYFLSLYDGLINTRKRGIRSDWKESFCRLMHWPISSEIDRVDSRHAVIIIKDKNNLSTDFFSKKYLEDLLRVSLVYGISALDRYVHERVIKSLISSLKPSVSKKKLTRQQENLSMPIYKVIKLLEDTRKRYKNGENPRPTNAIRVYAQEVLHTETYQSWREIEDAFMLIGIRGFAGKVQDIYKIDDISSIRKTLNSLVKRRNQIVHEGDLVIHKRGGTPKRRDIEKKYVEDGLKFIRNFVYNIDNIE